MPRPSRRVFTIACVALAALTVTTTARADGLVDRASDGAPRLGLGPWRPRYVGGWLFDDPMRDLLRARTDAGRTLADRTSTGIEYSLLVAPFGLSLGTSLSLDPHLADTLGLVAIDAEAFLVSGLVTYAFKSLMGRERPFATASGLGTSCLDDAHRNDPACRGDRNASFLSGHTASAFTGAGLICAQRAYLGPGQPTWDAVACGAAMAGAATTALLRITADRHYATDTVAGALVGLGAGFVLPVALHFSDGAPLRPGGPPLMREQSAQDPGAVLIGMGAGIMVGAAIPLGIALVRHITHPRAVVARRATSPSL